MKFERRQVLLAKIETTFGTDAAPTGAANAILARNVAIRPMEGQDVSRDLVTPWFGAQPTIPTELHATLSFEVELAPSGTAGTPPAWGPLLRGCGCAQSTTGSSVTFNPISTGFESLTFHFFQDGTRYRMLGARGTASLRVAAQAIPVIAFQFTGLYEPVTDQANPTPTLSGWPQPQLATAANTPVFTLAGTALVLREFEMSLGVAPELRDLIGADARRIMITDRSETIRATVEAVALATFDPFERGATGTPFALALTHGTGAGRVASLAAPRVQMQRPDGLAAQQGVVEWPLRMVPLPEAGDDQWTLTLT